MADPKERRKTPHKAPAATPKHDSRSASTSASGGVHAQASSEETRRQIAEAAYFRAKERGFEPGHELEDWIEAESEVMGRINGTAR
jgi:hypothetical protein